MEDLKSFMNRDGIRVSREDAENMLWEVCEGKVRNGVTFRELALAYARAHKNPKEPRRLYSAPPQPTTIAHHRRASLKAGGNIGCKA